MGFEQFLAILFGLFVADYLLQPKQMAIMKSQRDSQGMSICGIHCAIYAGVSTLFLLGVSAFTINGMLIFHLFYWSHFIMDRYSLASKWLRMIQGRNFMEEYKNRPEYWEISIPFAAIVYVVVDNGLHILFMWYALTALVHFGILVL